MARGRTEEAIVRRRAMGIHWTSVNRVHMHFDWGYMYQEGVVVGLMSYMCGLGRDACGQCGLHV